MAELKGGKVVVSKDFEPIAEQGFGELEGKALALAPCEALYLVEKRKIEVRKGKKALDFEGLKQEFGKKEKRIGEIYSVFRDLRVAGYVARDGKVGVPCFRVYARGARPEEEPARYLLWVVEPKAKISIAELSKMLERSHAVRKKPVFAVSEKGTVMYYKIDTTKF